MTVQPPTTNAAHPLVMQAEPSAGCYARVVHPPPVQHAQNPMHPDQGTHRVRQMRMAPSCTTLPNMPSLHTTFSGVSHVRRTLVQCSLCTLETSPILLRDFILPRLLNEVHNTPQCSQTKQCSQT
jgi:hypothetical protein